MYSYTNSLIVSGRRVYSRDYSLIQVQSTCILAFSPVCSLMNDPQINIFIYIYLRATPSSSHKHVRNMNMPYFSGNRLKSIFTSIHLMYLLFFPYNVRFYQEWDPVCVFPAAPAELYVDVRGVLRHHPEPPHTTPLRRLQHITGK